jgi:DNA processing protein
MDSREALVAMNMIEGVGPVRVRQLLEHFGDAASVLRASRHQLTQVQGVGDEVAGAIASWEKTIDLPAELRRATDFGCRVITQLDDEYPASLREIYDPPIVLYIKGSLIDRDRNAVAVVGSRSVTPYGRETARKFGYQLAFMGVTVVSGGARGVDTAAHTGALAAKGRTVAVLGSGINYVIPPENAELFERIAASGAVITQFPFNRQADRQTFPIRNRIVAGMTLGTVVVEAALASGALITSNFAADYGRQVFAVPGRIDSPGSRGCHDLIKQGAKLCESVEDIVGEFEYLIPTATRLDTDAGAGPGGPASPSVLSEKEQRVLDVLGREEISIDEVIRLSGLPSASVSAALLSLEMKRAVRQMPGKMFARTA